MSKIPKPAPKVTNEDQVESASSSNEDAELVVFQRALSETQEQNIKPEATTQDIQGEYSSFSTIEEPEPKPNVSNIFTDLVKNEVTLIMKI